MVDRLVNTEINAKRMKHVEDCFGATGQPLCKVGRVLVGEGVLTKLCRKKPKPRQFFLFNDIFVYGNIVINKKMYNKQHIMPLEELKIVALEDDGNFKNGWQIVSPSKSFAVYAATPTEKAEWMAHIDKCIKDVLRKTGKTPSGDEAAVWVPDQSASVCMLCNKTKFTPIMRRHHCRRCGSVVCGSCSNKKFLILHISSKPVRVCNRCYDQISSGKVKVDDPVSSKTGSTPVQKFKPGDANSLTRNESEKITESGSSADEESEDEDEKSAENEPQFYGGASTTLPGETTNDSKNIEVAASADVEMAPPSRPSEPPSTFESHNNESTSSSVHVSSSYSSGGGGGGSSGGDHDSGSGGGGGGGGSSMDD